MTKQQGLHTVFILPYLLILFSLQGCLIFRQSGTPYKPEMIKVKGGTFYLGDFHDSTNTDAIPVHLVTVNDFRIGKYEVTYEQYDHYTDIMGLPRIRSDIADRGRRAVTYVTWDEALAFCNYYGYRLPTEIEWEYAARSAGKEQLYSGTNSKDSLAFYAVTRDLEVSHTLEVGILMPNELGLYDMSGNAFEWIGEFYQFYRDPELFPFSTRDGVRIIRGGSYNEETVTTRTYWRTGTLHDVRSEDIGFRCAVS